jgi:hypothetical protein
MPHRTEAEARPLLRLLFLRNGAVPARSAARQSRKLLRLTRAGRWRDAMSLANLEGEYARIVTTLEAIRML